MAEYENDFEIFELDLNRLDEEWRAQPKLYAVYARKLSRARRDYERAKAETKLAFAETALAIREDPDSYGIGRPTDKTVEACILTQREYKDAVRDEINAKYKMDIMDSYVKALDHRKKALENEVELFLANYFAAPRAKSEGTREHQNLMERRKAFKAIPKKKRREREEEDDE